MPNASGYYRTSYSQDFTFLDTRTKKISFAAFCLLLAVFPFVASTLMLDLANQVFLAAIGAIGLMLLTGFAGQISLGHAGLLAAGAFTTGILAREFGTPFWVTLPASAVTGAILGAIFGLPAIRLRGLYLAVSTLGLYFLVIYLASEYETRWAFSAGLMLDPLEIAGLEILKGWQWYIILLAFVGGTTLIALNLLRSKTGRAWNALKTNETVAKAMGVNVNASKLLVFVISSVITSVAGCLFAYYHSFVSVGAFPLILSIHYVAMVIIGGLGSILGALLGAAFVVLLPHVVETVTGMLPLPDNISGLIFSINQAVFGLVMISFLLFEPDGLVGIWKRIQNYFLLWPFSQTSGSGKG